MHKRKGKNKPKNPNPAQQTGTKVAEEAKPIEIPSEVKHDLVESKPEVLPQVPEVIELKETIQEVQEEIKDNIQPQKPKRNRGGNKKNQQGLAKEEITDKNATVCTEKQDVKPADIIDDANVAKKAEDKDKKENIIISALPAVVPAEETKLENVIEQIDNSATTSSKRKKKNKGKKGEQFDERSVTPSEVMAEKVVVEEKVIEKEKEVIEDAQSIVIEEIPSNKKKNKKNKKSEQPVQTDKHIMPLPDAPKDKVDEKQIPQVEEKVIKEDIPKDVVSDTPNKEMKKPEKKSKNVEQEEKTDIVLKEEINEPAVSLKNELDSLINEPQAIQPTKKSKKNKKNKNDSEFTEPEIKIEKNIVADNIEVPKLSKLSDNISKQVKKEAFNVKVDGDNKPKIIDEIPKDVDLELLSDLPSTSSLVTEQITEEEKINIDTITDKDINLLLNDDSFDFDMTPITEDFTEECVMTNKTIKQELIAAPIEETSGVKESNIDDIKIEEKCNTKVDEPNRSSDPEANKLISEIIIGNVPKPNKRNKKGKNKPSDDDIKIIEITKDDTPNTQQQEIKTPDIITPEAENKKATGNEEIITEIIVEPKDHVKIVKPDTQVVVQEIDSNIFKQEIEVQAAEQKPLVIEKPARKEKNKKHLHHGEKHTDELSLPIVKEIRRSRSKEREPRSSPDLKMPKHNIENLFPHFKESAIKSKPESPPEQTDLKTKVVEVNKTMEDLKQSIERSLAELTNIDETQQKHIAEGKTELAELFLPLKSKADPLLPIKNEAKTLFDSNDDRKMVTPPLEIKESKGKGKGKGKKMKKPEELESENVKATITELVVNVSKDEKEKTPTKETEPAMDTLKLVDNFEDALTSSVEDVDAKFEQIVTDDQSKNLQGPHASPVASSKMDYKKEKDKIIQPPRKKNKGKLKENLSTSDSAIQKISSEDEDEEYVYKYSFRKVFIANSCNVCKAVVKNKKFECNYCHLVFYCNQKHKDEDWSSHQGFCFAVSTVAHLKGLKYIYSEAKNLSGQDWRLKRMQVIVACEKVLKRKLQPYEQEMLLYPRLCMEQSCREWKTSSLMDCENCGQISYCAETPTHLTDSHKEWCKAYQLYFQLVAYQQTKGRLEPKLPTKIVKDIGFTMPGSMKEMLDHLYDGKIDMDDMHYASLTQIATAPLTASYANQIYNNKLYNTVNGGPQIPNYTLHIVGAEMQFEADIQHKWELFFLHLYPEIKELKVVFVGPELNPGNLPLDLLAKIKFCKQCKKENRKIYLEYEDKQLYHDFVKSKHFTKPDLVCAFNPGLHRTTGFNSSDTWPETISSILKLNVPFCVTSYTRHELPKDLLRVKECQNQVKIHLEPSPNPYASLRPDRNFISDDEMPLIFKNYWIMVVSG